MLSGLINGRVELKRKKTNIKLMKSNVIYIFEEPSGKWRKLAINPEIST